MIELAVLITCHNRKEKTLACLQNLFCQDEIDKSFNVNVYLVDDDSRDGTSLEVANKFPSVNIINGSGELFWNRGMHLSWATASIEGKYDYYLWLNDDTMLFKNALVELFTCASRVNDLTIVCGAACSATDNAYTYGLSTIKGNAILPNDLGIFGMLMNGNCVLISKEIFNLVGNLDSTFPHAIGDYDYGLRLIARGGAIVTTTKYIAYCEKNLKDPSWCYSGTPLLKRLKVLYSPLGNSHPYYFFRYESRHFGYLKAIKHYLSIHLRAIIPSLWK